MLRLKGVTIFDETKEFYMDRVVAIDGSNGNWWVEIGSKTYVLDPATIQPADDPRKVLIEHEVLTRVHAMGEESLSPDNFEGLMRALEALKTTRNVDGEDPRKAMLDEIRNQLAVFPSPSLCDDCFNDGFGEAVHKVFDLIDEMETKL